LAFQMNFPTPGSRVGIPDELPNPRFKGWHSR